jgi:hypothetical protein
MSEEMIKSLKAFVEDWLNAAEIDGIELCKVQVSLVSILSDICELAEINPTEIGLMVSEAVGPIA